MKSIRKDYRVAVSYIAAGFGHLRFEMTRTIDPELLRLLRSLLVRDGNDLRFVEGGEAILEEARALFEVEKKTLDAVIDRLGVQRAFARKSHARRSPRAPMFGTHAPAGSLRVADVRPASVIRP
jgi:hypothetical protein